MKTIFTRLYSLLLSLALLFGLTGSLNAQSFSEDFNTRNAANNCDRAVYTAKCWMFSSASVSSTNAIDGCSIYTSPLSNAIIAPVPGGNRVNFPYEIRTPVLRITSPASVTFNAKLTGTSSNPVVYVIADPVGSAVNSFTLATIPTSAAGLTTTSKAFTASFTPPSGDYVIRFGISGSGGASRLVIDNIFVANVSEIAQPASCQLLALPVTLTEFGADQTTNTCKVQLRWATSAELTNREFIVERSADARSFEPIGRVAGRGTTNQLQRYSFDDEQPLPVSYYRLKQVDLDQHTEYSKIIAVVSRCTDNGIVFQYSQATSQLDILLNEVKAVYPLSVDFFTLSGQRLHSLKIAQLQPVVSVRTAAFGGSLLLIRITDERGKLLRSQRLLLPQ